MNTFDITDKKKSYLIIRKIFKTDTVIFNYYIYIPSLIFRNYRYIPSFKPNDDYFIIKKDLTSNKFNQVLIDNPYSLSNNERFIYIPKIYLQNEKEDIYKLFYFINNIKSSNEEIIINTLNSFCFNKDSFILSMDDFNTDGEVKYKDTYNEVFNTDLYYQPEFNKMLINDLIIMNNSLKQYVPRMFIDETRFFVLPPPPFNKPQTPSNSLPKNYKYIPFNDNNKDKNLLIELYSQLQKNNEVQRETLQRIFDNLFPLCNIYNLPIETQQKFFEALFKLYNNLLNNYLILNYHSYNNINHLYPKIFNKSITKSLTPEPIPTSQKITTLQVNHISPPPNIQSSKQSHQQSSTSHKHLNIKRPQFSKQEQQRKEEHKQTQEQIKDLQQQIIQLQSQLQQTQQQIQTQQTQQQTHQQSIIRPQPRRQTQQHQQSQQQTQTQPPQSIIRPKSQPPQPIHSHSTSPSQLQQETFSLSHSTNQQSQQKTQFNASCLSFNPSPEFKEKFNLNKK